MKLNMTALSASPLFKGLSDVQISHILKGTCCILSSYKRNQIIAVEGETCTSIGIIVKGSVDIKRIFASGKALTITTMNIGDIFGEVLVFSETNKYPSTIIAVKDTDILYIPRESIPELCHSSISFMNNIMSLLANKVLMFNEKIKYLSLQTIRQRISTLLLDYSKNQNSLELSLPFNRKEMAELLGVPRPSLSREMIRMSKEGIISFHKSNVVILNVNELEEILLN